MTRRSFFVYVAKASAAAYVLASGMGSSACRWVWGERECVRDLKLKSLSVEEGKTLWAIARTLFPHAPPKDKYNIVVKRIDDELSGTADKALHLDEVAKWNSHPDWPRMLREAIAQLDLVGGKKFFLLGETAQEQALRSLEMTPFFRAMRNKIAVHYYYNHEIWPYFGYDGSAFERGGYLHRGFNDLDWR